MAIVAGEQTSGSATAGRSLNVAGAGSGVASTAGLRPEIAPLDGESRLFADESR